MNYEHQLRSEDCLVRGKIILHRYDAHRQIRINTIRSAGGMAQSDRNQLQAGQWTGRYSLPTLARSSRYRLPAEWIGLLPVISGAQADQFGEGIGSQPAEPEEVFFGGH